jgi:hypothetical protein
MAAAFADQLYPPPNNIRQPHALAKIFDKFGRHRHNLKLRLAGQLKGVSLLGLLLASNQPYRYHKPRHQNHQIWTSMSNMESGEHDKKAAKPQRITKESAR